MSNHDAISRRAVLKSSLALGGAAALGAMPNRMAAAPLASPARQEATTLEFWSRFDFLAGAIDLYNQQAADSGKQVRVNFTTVPADQMVNKLTAALASKTQPDVMSIDLIQCPYFNSLGAFVDLTDRYNELPFRDEFAPGMLQLGAYEDRQYQLPFAADNSALIWNKDIFREAGLDPEQGPAIWQDLIDSAGKATQAPDHFGIGFDAQSGGTFMFRWMPFVWGNGGDLLNADGSKSAINSPQALEALQLWVDLIHKYNATPPGTATWNGDDLRAAFQAGKIAMMISGNFVVALLNRDAPDLDYGTTLIPAPGPDGAHSSFAGGDMMGILTGSQREAEGWDLLQFLASEPVQVEYLAKSGIIPVRTSMYDNAYFAEEPAYQTFTQALDVARAPWTLKYNRLYDALQANLQQALAGEKAPEQALQDIEAAHNQILAG
ncbi:MAG: ABC transporter substrate-binding protein [Thermomicrobiales bacterium]|nr:ABC transporter substrate-binding protein [Thermomicrobiales bacterium]